jgi:hypothetical protein
MFTWIRDVRVPLGTSVRSVGTDAGSLLHDLVSRSSCTIAICLANLSSTEFLVRSILMLMMGVLIPSLVVGLCECVGRPLRGARGAGHQKCIGGKLTSSPRLRCGDRRRAMQRQKPPEPEEEAWLKVKSEEGNMTVLQNRKMVLKIRTTTAEQYLSSTQLRPGFRSSDSLKAITGDF